MFRIESPEPSVALLRMDDGKVNAMGPPFVEGFRKAWSDATAGERAVVIVGNAKAFCAGLDLKTLPQLDREGLVRFGRGFMGLFAEVASYGRPVVAAIDGPALAGGAVLALSCDFRLVGPKARLALTEVPIGVPFPRPIVDLAVAALPPQEHAPAILRGTARVGEDCVRTGWAHEALPSEELENRAVGLAAELASFSPIAYAAAKRAFRGATAGALTAFATKDADAWADLLALPETMDGIRRGFERATAKK